jgi:hypothetical protein
MFAFGNAGVYIYVPCWTQVVWGGTWPHYTRAAASWKQLCLLMMDRLLGSSRVVSTCAHMFLCRCAGRFFAVYVPRRILSGRQSLLPRVFIEMTTGGGEFGKIRFRNAHVTERAAVFGAFAYLVVIVFESSACRGRDAMALLQRRIPP